MAYLIPSDYNRLIQDVALSQVISGNKALINSAELASMAELKSYTVQKYDIAKEFTNTLPYDPSLLYSAASRVYLTANAYNPTFTYNLLQLTTINGLVYQNSTAITIGEPFTLSKWLMLGMLNDIFYCQLPLPEFQLTNGYSKGDKVFWKNQTYTCLQASVYYSHDSLLQYNNTANYPSSNVFPDAINAASYWLSDGPFIVPANMIYNSIWFTFGDNRNQQIVLYLLDITIYHLYRRIAPTAIPESRVDGYNVAIGWLKNVAKGNDITADIPKIQPTSGRRIRFGTDTKQETSY